MMTLYRRFWHKRHNSGQSTVLFSYQIDRSFWLDGAGVLSTVDMRASRGKQVADGCLLGKVRSRLGANKIRAILAIRGIQVSTLKTTIVRFFPRHPTYRYADGTASGLRQELKSAN